MIVIGAKGHAKEVLELLINKFQSQELYFFDNVSKEIPDKFMNKFTIIKSLEKVPHLFESDKRFISGIGNPIARRSVVEKFLSLGGNYQTIISDKALIGSFEVEIGNGCNIMSQVFISNSVSIGQGCLINKGASIHHDVVIGNYCDISPMATILGRVTIGDNVLIGAGAVVLPDIIIGNNTIIGASSVVTKDVNESQVVYGNPAKPKS